MDLSDELNGKGARGDKPRIPGTAGGDYRERIYRGYLASCGTPTDADVSRAIESRRPYLSSVIARLLPEDRGARIIDLGCGHGAFVKHARAAGYRFIVGYDRAPDQIAAGKRLGIEGIQQGDLFGAVRDLPDGSCDAIITFDVIEHLTKNELIVCIDEIRRALKPGGRWLIHAPNAESSRFGRIRYGDFTHEFAITRESLAQILIASGFGRIECFEDTPVPHGVKSSVRWLLWMVVRSALLAMDTIETGYFDRGSIFTRNLLAVAFK